MNKIKKQKAYAVHETQKVVQHRVIYTIPDDIKISSKLPQKGGKK